MARPGEVVAGMSLLARAVLEVQKRGPLRIAVVVDRADEPALEALRRDARVRVPLDEVVADRAAAAAKVARWLEDQPDEPVLLARHDVVADGALYQALTRPLLDDIEARLAVDAGAPLGLLYARPAFFAHLGSLEPDSLAAQEHRCEGRVVLDDVARTPRAFAVRLSAGSDRRRAVEALFEACRKPVDGFISRHINRHVSLFISRRLVGLPVSPNTMTVVTFLVGVAAAVAALRGGYLPTLVGAALMQLNSILDGVDGELARVRHQGSKLGQWLDTIGDDASNFLFYAALAVGARSEPLGEWWSLAGWIVAGTTVASALLYYTELAGSGSGDLYSIEWDFEKGEAATLGTRLMRWGHLLLKQDTFIFLWLCAAAAGYLHQTLPVFALGGVIVVIAAAARRLSNGRGGRRSGAAA